eukprot:maker-scaffold2822_size12116-snap-gene-0.4 protein:Tk01018 transcript:maker-scaffold2822_size12116-snap-gene-0.4-mRNA-1 annotation:"carbohydrate sulfotransferase 8-like"
MDQSSPFASGGKMDHLSSVIGKGDPRDNHSVELAQSKQIQRLQTLMEGCRNHPRAWVNVDRSNVFQKFLFEPKSSLAYCHIPKVASSWWFSIFEQILPERHSLFSDKIVHQRMLDRSVGVHRLPKRAFKMVFVRHPIKRLVSAYVNKFVNENTWNFLEAVEAFLGQQSPNSAREKVENVTFAQFVDFVLDEITQGKITWGTYHWLPQYNFCRICDTELQFLGKLETFASDVELLKLQHPSIVPYIPLDKDVSKEELNAAINNDDRIVHQYLSQLSRPVRNNLCQVYDLDFQLFNYSCSTFKNSPDVVTRGPFLSRLTPDYPAGHLGHIGDPASEHRQPTLLLRHNPLRLRH